MTSRHFMLTALSAGLSFVAGIGPARADTQIDISQQPLITVSSQPPLNMLVMGKDHKIYYEAYNDASDLDGDGALDVGYKPATIDYYGYFNSHVCYTYESDNGGRFVPSSTTSDKTCSGKWSGDFLNYLTTSRMDALRRVLYGGWRQVDDTDDTTLQGAFFPQDAHSWGKEYQSTERDGYDISLYSTLAQPGTGKYHLFAVTTVTGNDAAYPGYTAPLFRVMANSTFRVWNWLSIEGPVAGNKCFNASNSRVNCVSGGTASPWEIVPEIMFDGLTITTWKRTSGSGSPGDLGAMNTLFDNNATDGNLCGSGPVGNINDVGTSINPFAGNNGCGQDNYLTEISGTIEIPEDGDYTFGIDGDDAIDLYIDGTRIACWYGGHAHNHSDASLDSHSGTVTLAAGDHTITFRHQEAAGGEAWELFWKPPASSANSLTDYKVRVQVCPDDSDLQDASCKKYGDHWKPTGILHDYGENQKMYFGLITGSQFDNLEGGVLRRNISDFADEIDPATGQFLDVDGIANTLSKLRMIGGGYNSGVTDNSNGDTNWNWANGNGNCPSIGDQPIKNGECRMWGNPIAEMMFEGMRYFAGAGAATSRFATGGADIGATEEETMDLSQATWQDPYASDGGGYAVCSRPFETVISDINPSYDGDLPGSAFTEIGADASVAGFNAASEGDTIWNHEFGGPRTVFIGEVDGVTDGAPTAKTASSFGNIRGLAPEEPTKGGTYYSASVARYGAANDLNEAEGTQRMSVYSIALASPLPRIEFPVNGKTVTLLPFAKTESGTFGEGTRKPTNTIVDFYVEKIVNLPGQPFDATVNEGRASAIFRINYEDVEQGNDHDMDSIVRYLIEDNGDGTVTVTLNSEYAAGSANQDIGYVMSGTTQDGVYLDVRDVDSNHDAFYALKTPNRTDLDPDVVVNPGGCAVATPPAVCSQRLLFDSTRTFTVSSTAPDTTELQNPLWYAAKYGGFNDSNANGLPDSGEWDSKVAGEPDNYFLVTNALGLRDQLDEAFQSILDDTRPSASVATSTGRFTPGSTLGFRVNYKAESWAGDVDAYPLLADGTLEGIVYNPDDGTFAVDTSKRVWSASEELPAPESRNIFVAEKTDSGYSAVDFEEDELSDDSISTLRGTLDAAIDTGDLIAFLRGDSSKEQGASGCSDASPCPFRDRQFDEDPHYKFGDILNSSPVVVVKTSYGFAQLPDDVAGKDAYVEFVNGKSEAPVIYVGANDGMVHAINGEDSSYGDGGKELFAFIPNAVLGSLSELSRPGYLHQYFVDGTPVTGDAYVAPAGGTLGWRTLLLGSAGVGARAVYALDVSDPEADPDDIFLWEFNSSDDADMGYLSGQPAMGLVGTPSSSRWIAAFGNGMNSARGKAILFIRDLGTGAEVAKVEVPDTDTVDPERPNGLSTPVIVDGDGDGVADTIYAGDYQGNMWKFENNGGVWSVGLGGQPLFTAIDVNGHPQSITSGAYTVANPIGGTMVIFGTGRYFNTEDADPAYTETADGETEGTPLVDTIYGVWDRSITGVSCNDDAYYAIHVSSCGPVPALERGDGAILQKQEITGYNGHGHGFAVDPDTGTATQPVCPEGYRCSTRNPVDYQTASFTTGKLGWYLDLGYPLGTTSTDLLRAERVLAQPTIILGTLLASTFRPIGSTCLPGGFNALMELDPLSGAAQHSEIAPPGGWPGGVAPPLGTSGIDMGAGPPQGSPNPVVSTPSIGGIPTFTCDPGSSEECPDPETPGIGFTDCKWMLPNPANKSIQSPMPCGRISWKQAR